MKDEVYSWRVSAQRKAELETEAGRKGTSLAELLESITSEWLEAKQALRQDEEKRQARLRARAAKCLGSIAGGNPKRAEEAMGLIRQRLRKRHAHQRPR